VRYASAVLVTAAFAVAQASAAPFCQVVTGRNPAPLVRQAATELSSYLVRLTDGAIPVAEEGTGGDGRILLMVEPAATNGNEEEYTIGPTERPRTLSIYGTPLGVLHGAYRLLREYGIGFYFDGDAVPTEPPARFLTPTIHGSPGFAVRGSLPWCNFLDSPTTWDDQDFRFFADQIIRSGQNFIGFHTYDFEPFAAYEWEGKLVGGEPLMTTADHVWGTEPLAADAFGFGTGRFFPGKFWGSDVARMEGSREQRVAAQKALLVRGLSYASARGVKTCLGFEISGDPTDPNEQRQFRARLRQLVIDYPMLDYVWLWQPEARSLEGTAPPPLRSQGGKLYRDWEHAFAYVGSPARMWEGMRVAAYGRLGQQLVDDLAPSVRLALSGWGGDHHLHVSDYFPAWDQVLDKRIIFAALDDIVVGSKVSQYYQLPPDRERWAIPWYEFDGDQWFPQANAHVFAETVRDAKAKGCQGLLAIHWRTKEVGESQALCAQYAWNPEETLDRFYRDYGTRRVGPKLGSASGAILQELDGMGYRWLGGGGQAECGTFAWCHVDSPEREGKLHTLHGRLLALRNDLAEARCPSGALGRVDDAIATIDRVLLFNRIAGLLVAGGPADRALAMEPGEVKKAECRRLLGELTGADFGDMLNLYARTITSRGELGVLATVNGKAFVDLRRKVAALREACGESTDVSDLNRADPKHRDVVSDYQLSSVAAGTPLTVRCVAYQGERPARSVQLEYCTSDAGQWARLPMALVERSVFEATVPVEAIRPGWVRYRAVAELPDGKVVWPEVRGETYRQVAVFPADALTPRRNQVDTSPARMAQNTRLEAKATEVGTIRLTWTKGWGLPEVVVERKSGDDWVTLGSTLDWEWEDATAPPNAEVEYRLVSVEKTELARCAVRTPPAPQPTSPAGLSARPRGMAVKLWWSGADLTVSHYSVERADKPEGPFETVSPKDGIAPQGFGETSFVDRPRKDGTVSYRVRAHGADPNVTSVSEPVSAQALAKVPKPLLDLEFDGSVEAPTGPVEWSGPHSFEMVDGRGVLRTEGGLAIPYGEAIAVKEQFTVAIRFCQAKETPIPVLVCQGAWQGPGYFVQLMGETFRFYVSRAGTLDRRVSVRPGEWHTMVCVYDDVTLASYLDGILQGEQRATGPLQPSTLPLTVARYSSIGPEWIFKGDVDFVRLYDRALEPWMVMRSKPETESVLDLEWTSPEIVVSGQEAVWHQPPAVVDTDHGKAVDLKGGLTIPFSDMMAVGDNVTIETSFLLRDVAGMPVLLNQGLWPSEGYMLQILGGRIRFHIGGVGSLDCGPAIEANRWYSVRCTYDGTTATVYLDGKQVGEMTSSEAMNPSVRPLRIGRYEVDAAQYVVDGLMGTTRVFGGVVSGQ